MNLLTTGEFARLSRTTKRTVLFYHEKGILRPYKVGRSKYRYYKPEQIIDFQAILLLRKMGFSLKEIRKYLAEKNSLKELFRDKRQLVRTEIQKLIHISKKVDEYYRNLDKVGFLIRPKVKKMKHCEIYYISKIGSYDKIRDYTFELASYFRRIPKKSVYLTVFVEAGFKPKNTLMEIGVALTARMELTQKARDIVKHQSIPAHNALSYTHHGSGRLLSMLWRQFEEYFDKNSYVEHKKLRCYEFYHRTSINGYPNEDNHIFELLIPIK